MLSFSEFINESVLNNEIETKEYQLLKIIANHLNLPITGDGEVKELVFSNLSFADINITSFLVFASESNDLDLLKFCKDQGIDNIEKLSSLTKYNFPSPEINKNVEWSGVIERRDSIIKCYRVNPRKLIHATLQKTTYYWNFQKQEWEKQGTSIDEELEISEFETFIEMLEKPKSQMPSEIIEIIRYAKEDIEKITSFEFFSKVFSIDAQPFIYYGNKFKSDIEKWKRETESFLIKNKSGSWSKVAGRKYGI